MLCFCRCFPFSFVETYFDSFSRIPLRTVQYNQGQLNNALFIRRLIVTTCTWSKKNEHNTLLKLVISSKYFCKNGLFLKTFWMDIFVYEQSAYIRSQSINLKNREQVDNLRNNNRISSSINYLTFSSYIISLYAGSSEKFVCVYEKQWIMCWLSSQQRSLLVRCHCIPCHPILIVIMEPEGFVFWEKENNPFKKK